MNTPETTPGWQERATEFIETHPLLMYLILFAIITLIVYIFDPLNHFGRDWDWYYKPAALALIQGRDVYSVVGYSAPPWAALPLIPFALLPDKLGYCMFIACSIAVSAYTIRKYSNNRWAVLICLLSPFYSYMFIQGNIDWMALLAFVLPGPASVVVASIKPQVTIVLMLYWLIVSYRDGGIRQVVLTFLPLAIVAGLAFAVSGNWPAKMLAIRENVSGHNPLWPYSIPIAALLIYRLFRARIDQDKKNIAAISSPLLSPYVQPYSWAGVALGLSPKPLEALVFVLASWSLLLLEATIGLP